MKRTKTPQRRRIKKRPLPPLGPPKHDSPPPVPARRFLLARQPDGLSPRNLEEAMQLAQYLSDSNLVPKEYRGKPGDILIAIGLGHEVGLKWAQALQSIAVIGGRPAIWGDAGLGLVMSHPDYEGHKEADDEATQTAACTIKRRGLDPVTRKFGQADAERITVYERDAQGNTRQVRLADRPVWKAGYGVRMRQMRARWWAMKDTFPDALKGIEGREWVEDDLAAIREPRDEAPALRPEDVMPRRKPPEGEGVVAEVIPPPEKPTQPAARSHEESSSSSPQTTAGERKGSPVGARAEQKSPPSAELTPAEVKTGQSTLPLAPPGGAVVEINGRQLVTGGITRPTLLKCYKMGAQLDELTAKGQAKELLGREFGLEHRHELTEEAGQKYVAALARRVNAALKQRR